jgi:F0F1-type ATP synthase epsilon subunit
MAVRQDASTGELVDDGKPVEGSADGTSMLVKVYAPSKVYFEGEAQSISAASQTGPFDILPKHHNFITLLTACEIVVRTKTNEEKIRIQAGIMHVKADSVVVFLDV